MVADVDELREELRVLEARDERIIAILQGEDEGRPIPFILLKYICTENWQTWEKMISLL